MKKKLMIIWGAIATIMPISVVNADSPSAFGSGFDVQDFHKPFSVKDITPENMQKWPYYKYASVHWNDYAVHGTKKLSRSTTPANLAIAEKDELLDLNTEWENGQSFIESLFTTQVKAFVVMKDNKILAEFFDNGFTLDDTQLLQSASKTIAGVIGGRLVDDGLLYTSTKVETYLKDFKGTDLGAATVQQLLDMTSGAPNLLDYHTPGADGQLFEVEIGLQPGVAKGHRNNLKATKSEAKPGEAYNYSDKNTDLLGLVYEEASGKTYVQLVSELFDAFSANDDGSIALTSDGTASANYGVSMTARDYALFHQWIAQGKAPKCFYKSATDASKTKFGENEAGKLFGKGITYGSQSYYMKEHNILYSQGSYGQQGFSDLDNGIAVIFMQDWAVNAEIDKLLSSRDKAVSIINKLRAQSAPGFLRDQ
jgi:CubicO group peptidase (beta-lactamase class C family)